MALPKEPRQKMINLMYLVLTALLALNVSAEILNAFKTVDNSLTGTNRAINHSTGTIMASLETKMTEAETAEKAKVWYPKAQTAQALSKEMFDYIENLKSIVLKEAGFDPAKKGDSTYKEDNQDIATRLLVEGKYGKELNAKLTEYRKKMIEIEPSMKAELEQKMQIDMTPPPSRNSKKQEKWEGAYFRMVPTVAAITILSKFQNDVKTSENRVVAHFHEQVGKVAVRFDTYTAIVGQSSNYVMPGSEIEVMAGVGAFSRAAAPTITINGRGAPLGEDGAARLKFPAGPVGDYRIPVTINYTDQEGKKQSISKTVEYKVGQANAAISLDKMNVLYIGVENPVTIAASGGSEQIKASIAGGGGSISGGAGGKYIVRVNTPTEDCTITVMLNGKVAGSSRFRVRTIPDPVATIGGYPSGENMNAGTIKAQAGVGAYIKDFPFELKYTVTSFILTGDTEDGDIIEAPCTGNTWSPAARNLLQRIKPGATVTVDNIRALGPDGRTRRLPSLVYYIK